VALQRKRQIVVCDATTIVVDGDLGAPAA